MFSGEIGKSRRGAHCVEQRSTAKRLERRLKDRSTGPEHGAPDQVSLDHENVALRRVGASGSKNAENWDPPKITYDPDRNCICDGPKTGLTSKPNGPGIERPCTSAE